MSLLVVGSVALDSVETPFGKVDDALGGTASYFALAARSFVGVKIVGVVGEDFPGEYLSIFKRRGIDTEGLQVVQGKTFRWAGRYDYDLNTAHTLDTQLNVFMDFHPVLPPSYRQCDLVFLGNIHPALQLDVLSQTSPKLSVLDSMNFWIERNREELTRVIEKVDVVLFNEAEVRQYARAYNLIVAARRILELGPRALIIKRGEYGAMMVTHDDELFMAPAFPLESVKDPTGAGDSFAGGFLGYLAGTRDIGSQGIRKAMIHGTVIASFTVEDFSVNRLLTVTDEEIKQRYEALKRLTFFDHHCKHAANCDRLELAWN